MAPSTAGLLTPMSVSVILGQYSISKYSMRFKISLQARSSWSSAKVQHDNSGDLWSSTSGCWSQPGGPPCPHQTSLITNFLNLRFQ